MGLPNPNAGPGKNLEGPNRVRNTQTSNSTKNGGNYQKPPSVPNFGESYGSVAGATGSLAGAWASLQQQLDMSKAQRKGLKAQGKTDRANARAQAVGAMSDAINQGIENNMTGSSQVGQARTGVLAQRRTDIETANTTMKAGILESKSADQAAITSFEITKQQVEMQAAAARQAAEIAAAQTAAMEQGNANMLAYMENQGRTVTAKNFMGFGVEQLDGGAFKIAGITFQAGVPEARVRAILNARRAATAVNTPSELGFGGYRG